jgi:hypothetical protein
MINNFFQHVSEDSPSTGHAWVHISESERLIAVTNCLADRVDYTDTLQAISAKEDGQVTFKLKRELSVAIRGGFLLDLEQKLKNELELGITVWLEPMGDRSSLRKLRGVEVKI